MTTRAPPAIAMLALALAMAVAASGCPSPSAGGRPSELADSGDGSGIGGSGIGGAGIGGGSGVGGSGIGGSRVGDSGIGGAGIGDAGIAGSGVGGAPGTGGAVSSFADASVTPRDGGVTCSDFPGGCLCVAGAPTSGACSAESVKTGSQASGEASVCCNGGAVCHCQAQACNATPAQSLCTCGNAALIDSVAPGTRVAACPAPSGAGRCCLSADLTQCVCLPFGCDQGEKQVPGCSPSVLAICAAEEQAVPACN